MTYVGSNLMSVLLSINVIILYAHKPTDNMYKTTRIIYQIEGGSVTKFTYLASQFFMLCGCQIMVHVLMAYTEDPFLDL